MNEALAAGQEPQGTEEDKDAVLPQEASPEEPSSNTELKDTQPSEKVSTFAKRMQKLEAKVQAQVEAAKAEAEYWKQQALKKEPQAPATKTRLDFVSDDEWMEHRLEQERQRLLKEAQDAAQQTIQTERVVGTYQQRVNEAKKELPDWDEVFQQAQATGLTLPDEAVQFCLDSEMGAKIAYHLAKNEDEYDRFIEMSPVRRIAYLGKLEDKLVKPKETPKQVTKAPAKLTDVKTGGAVKTPPSGAERFQSKAAWREWYESQQRKR